jgi:hypothetical protein
MRLNNQAKVGLTTAACLLIQGYIFTYVLEVEPHFLLTIAPIFPYLAYVYARGRRTWKFDQPLYWIAAIVIITLADLAPYLLGLWSV